MLGRHEPLQPAAFAEHANRKTRLPCQRNGQRPQEIRGVGEIRSVRFARADLLDHSGEFRIRARQPGNHRVVALHQARNRNVVGPRRITHFDDGPWLALFRRVELRRARPQHPRLVEISAHRLLHHAVLVEPHLRPVFPRITDEHQLQERLIRPQLNPVVKLRRQRPQRLQVGDPDDFQVRVGIVQALQPVGTHGRVRRARRRAFARYLLVNVNGVRPRGDLPFRRSQQNADVSGINPDYPRCDRTCFRGLLDRGEDDAVERHVHNHAARGQVRDDLLFAALPARGRSGRRKGKQSRRCTPKA